MIWAMCYAVVLLIVSIILVRRNGFLTKRAEHLEEYARQLETWETKYKVRSVALSNTFRHARRLSDEDPRLAERFKRIEEELFSDEG